MKIEITQLSPNIYGWRKAGADVLCAFRKQERCCTDCPFCEITIHPSNNTAIVSVICGPKEILYHGNYTEIIKLYT